MKVTLSITALLAAAAERLRYEPSTSDPHPEQCEDYIDRMSNMELLRFIQDTPGAIVVEP